MQINTRLQRLELTKHKNKTLANAKELLLLLAKHGDGELSDAAEVAAEKIGEVVAALNAETVTA